MLEMRVKRLEEDVSEIKADLRGLRSDVSDLKVSVAGLERTVAGLPNWPNLMAVAAMIVAAMGVIVSVATYVIKLPAP